MRVGQGSGIGGGSIGTDLVVWAHPGDTEIEHIEAQGGGYILGRAPPVFVDATEADLQAWLEALRP